MVNQPVLVIMEILIVQLWALVIHRPEKLNLSSVDILKVTR